MITLPHAKTAVAASGRSGVCAANVPRCLQSKFFCDTGVVNKAFFSYLRHRSDYAACAPGFGVSRRVLDRFGYRISSIIAIYHAKTAMAASGRIDVCAVNVPRCRK